MVMYQLTFVWSWQGILFLCEYYNIYESDQTMQIYKHSLPGSPFCYKTLYSVHDGSFSFCLMITVQQS